MAAQLSGCAQKRTTLPVILTPSSEGMIGKIQSYQQLQDER